MYSLKLIAKMHYLTGDMLDGVQPGGDSANEPEEVRMVACRFRSRKKTVTYFFSAHRRWEVVAMRADKNHPVQNVLVKIVTAPRLKPFPDDGPCQWPLSVLATGIKLTQTVNKPSRWFV